MLDRRTLLLTAMISIAASSALAQAPESADPVAILTAIYTRAAGGKGDSGGAFIIANKAARSKYLSKSLVALWTKADARTPKGDVGPVDFDPVTNSQDPDVASFKITPDKMEPDKATVSVSFKGHHTERKNEADHVIRYDFVREQDTWKIDDIKGTVDGEAWSIRTLLGNSLKS